MQRSTLLKLKAEQEAKPKDVTKSALQFIDCLLDNGVSIFLIDVNHWNDSQDTIIYLHNLLNQETKQYKNQFNCLTLKNALKFLKA